MSEYGGVEPSPAGDCRSAQSLLRDLWVDGDLGDLPFRGAGAGRGGKSSTAPRRDADAVVPPSGGPGVGRGAPPRRDGRIETAVLRHIEDCPSCRYEIDDLNRLGQSLRMGLDSLCGAIAETMDRDIEGTLERLREESGHARFLRRVRRRFRLVLWISFLAFTLLASIGLAVAVYEALRGQ